MSQFWDTYVPDCIDCKGYERELTRAKKRIAELERQLADATTKANGYQDRLYQINLKLQPDKAVPELVSVEDATDDVMRQLAGAKEDTADLDYLDRAIGYDPLQIAWNDDYSNCWSLHSKQIGTTGKTLREAIRAARKERG